MFNHSVDRLDRQSLMLITATKAFAANIGSRINEKLTSNNRDTLNDLQRSINEYYTNSFVRNNSSHEAAAHQQAEKFLASIIYPNDRLTLNFARLILEIDDFIAKHKDRLSENTLLAMNQLSRVAHTAFDNIEVSPAPTVA